MRRPFPDGQPPSVRDFFAFEEHVRNARGAAVPPAWYEIPVFYFSNPAAVYRDGDVVPKPADTRMLDYELELAAVVGAGGGIEGFTGMNDWSARDLELTLERIRKVQGVDRTVTEVVLSTLFQR